MLPTVTFSLFPVQGWLVESNHIISWSECRPTWVYASKILSSDNKTVVLSSQLFFFSIANFMIENVFSWIIKIFHIQYSTNNIQYTISTSVAQYNFKYNDIVYVVNRTILGARLGESKTSWLQLWGSAGVVTTEPIPESAGLGRREHSNSNSCLRKLKFGEMFDFCCLTWS